MITVRLKGGMGNQMFQYAFGIAYAIKNNTSIQLDLRYLNSRTPRKNFVFRKYDLDIFKLEPHFLRPTQYLSYQIYSVLAFELIQKKLCWSNYNKIAGKYLETKDMYYDDSIWDVPDETYFVGYFQSYKYFDHLKKYIIEAFNFRHAIDMHAEPLLKKIIETESICLNVRRGDYLTDPILSLLDIDYYRNAVEHLQQILNNPTIYVFSDDIEWCQKNLHFSLPTQFVTHDYAGKKFRNYFELMINCKYYIIPNSSFGWWAAYLSRYPGKQVIAPKQWFKNYRDTLDLIPVEWNKI